MRVIRSIQYAPPSATEGMTMQVEFTNSVAELGGLSSSQLARIAAEAGEEFKRALAEQLDRNRSSARGAAQAERTASREDFRTSVRRGVTSAPTCGCGMSVANRGDKCVECAMKQTGLGPEPALALTNQGEPPYHTKGNFRRLPQVDA